MEIARENCGELWCGVVDKNKQTKYVISLSIAIISNNWKEMNSVHD